MTVPRSKSSREKGYILLSIMLLMTLMVIALTIEAPRIAQQIKREREEELIHRGNEYKIAIKKFFRKFGRYPLSIDELVSTNNMRFLRKRYKDPITGKDDWRLLHQGEVQINPLQQRTNAPGQPLGQPAGSSIGNPGGLNSGSLFPSQPPAGAQSQPSQNLPGTASVASVQNSPGTTPPAVGLQPQGQPTGTMGLTATSGSNSPVQFGGGQIIGVASPSKSESIKEINGKNHYDEWFFVYDPRLEQQSVPPGAPGAAGANPVGGMAPGQMNPGGQMNAPGLFGQPSPMGQPNPPGQMNPPQPPPVPKNPQ